MTKLLLNITHGFQARMLLRSAISETLLARGASLVVVSRAATEPYFRQEFEHPQVTLEDMPRRLLACRSPYDHVAAVLADESVAGRHAQLSRTKPFAGRPPSGTGWAARATRCWDACRRFVGRLSGGGEGALLAAVNIDDLLLRHRPDLVVTGSPGYNPYDIHLLRSRQALGHTHRHGDAVVGQSDE